MNMTAFGRELGACCQRVTLRNSADLRTGKSGLLTMYSSRLVCTSDAIFRLKYSPTGSCGRLELLPPIADRHRRLCPATCCC